MNPFVVPSDHSVRLSVVDPITITVAGGTLYYAEHLPVSSTTNDGSVADRGSLDLDASVHVISASRSNVTVSDRVVSSPQYGAMITSTIATSLSPNVLTPIVFDTVVADNNGFWDPDFPTRLTVRQPGFYFIQGNVEFTANVNGERQVFFRRNGGEGAIGGGSTDLGHGEPYVVSSIPTDTPQVHAKTAAVLDAGDYVEMFGAAFFAAGDEATLTTRHVPPNTPQLAVLYQGPPS